MGVPENELGGVYVYVPKGARLNIDNKEEEPPTTKYEKQRSTVESNVTKKLCGGKYGQDSSQG